MEIQKKRTKSGSSDKFHYFLWQVILVLCDGMWPDMFHSYVQYFKIWCLWFQPCSWCSNSRLAESSNPQRSSSAWDGGSAAIPALPSLVRPAAARVCLLCSPHLPSSNPDSWFWTVSGSLPLAVWERPSMRLRKLWELLQSWS